MIGNTVQFRTADAAIKAYINADVSAWAIRQGKQHLFKGMGAEDLTQFLQLMQDGGMSNAVYTLCMFEDITDVKKIKSSTDYDQSFNFRLNGEGQEITTYQYNKLRENNELISRLAAMESKFDEILKIEEPEEKPHALGAIGDILAHPAIAPILPTLLQSLVGQVFGQKQTTGTPYQAAPVVNLSNTRAGVGNIQTPTDNNNIQQSLQILIARDPKIAEHLAKFAYIAQADPNAWNIITSTLDGYAIPA